MKKKFSLFMFVTLLLTLGGGLAFLASWDIPAPVSRVEKVLPDDNFPK